MRDEDGAVQMLFTFDGLKPIALTLSILMGSVTWFAAPATAKEVFETGNSLKADCDMGDTKDASGFLVRGYCVGYIKGIADAMNGDSLSGFRACMPSGLIVSQVVGIVRQYMNTHPESLHFAASGLVALSFATAFPCRK